MSKGRLADGLRLDWFHSADVGRDDRMIGATTAFPVEGLASATIEGMEEAFDSPY